MISLRVCVTLMLSTILRVTDGLNAYCGPLPLPGWEHLANKTCTIIGVDPSRERDRLEFNQDGLNTSAITIINLFTSKDDTIFSTFPAEICETFPNLAYIVAFSNLKRFSRDDCHGINLESVIVSRNKISELNTLNGLKNLKEIFLGKNELTIIQRGTFEGVNELLHIDLSGNQIHTIEDGAFDAPNLKILFLHENKLKKLSDLLFTRTPKLTNVQIYKNELSHIGRSLFSLKNLFLLDLHDNHIEDINLVDFASLPSLGNLYLRNNGFSFNVTKQAKISQNLSIENTSLWDLDLESNNLTDSRDLNELGIFKGLRSLWVACNPFTNFELSAKEMKTLFPNLERLSLIYQGSRCLDVYTLRDNLNQLNTTLDIECVNSEEEINCI